MGKIIYSRAQYRITEVHSNNKKGYIIFNINKDFKDGHTHLNNYHAAKYVIDLAVREKLPYDLDKYRLKSLHRILGNGVFRDKVSQLITTKENKKKEYYYNIGVKETVRQY